jgi:hypothetical protein
MVDITRSRFDHGTAAITPGRLTRPVPGELRWWTYRVLA